MFKDNNYSVLSRTPIRKDPGGEPFELATSDVVLIHIAIFLSANHWVRLGGNPSTVKSALYYHKVEAIRIINERLRDPATAKEDSTVGAVAAITLAEVRYSLETSGIIISSNLSADYLWKPRDRNLSLEWVRVSDEITRRFAHSKLGRTTATTNFAVSNFPFYPLYQFSRQVSHIRIVQIH